MRGFRQWRWHLDEMYVKMGGEMHYLWRAVAHEVICRNPSLPRPATRQALRFVKKTMKRYGKPDAIVTDGLRSRGAARSS
jgi:putative transposase